MKTESPHEKTGKDFTGGGILALSGKRTTTGDPAFDARVDQLVKDWAGIANPDLIEELIISALRLARHDVSVAELKLLNRSVNELLSRRLISEDDFALFRITDDIEEAVHEFKHFYRVFHSYRFVRDKLVIRLQRRLSDTHIDRLNTDFSDLVKSGAITQGTALPQEADEESLTHLPRLIFTPHRRNYGRLRRLIDAINDCAPS